MTGPKTNDALLSGAVMETDRSRLLLPIFAPPGSQAVMGSSPVKLLRYVVPGVPEGNNAYELSPTNFRPLPSQRVAGGTSVVLGEAERDALVLFTRDAGVMHSLSTRIAKIRARAAHVARDVATEEFMEVELVEQCLAELGRSMAATRAIRDSAQNALRQCDAALASDPPAAYHQAQQAQQAVRAVQRAHWDAALAESQLLLDPFTAAFVTLPEHYRFLHEISSAPRSASRLAEGGFENLEAVLAAGWKHYQHQQEHVSTLVEMSPQAAHSGGLGLRMVASAEDAKNKPAVIESPPVWVASAPVQVERGDLVQIQGWLRIDQPITGTLDGLLVIDSLSGEALAQRFAVGEGWRQFTCYRAAPRSGPMTVTFALGGLGEVSIDDVAIQIVQRTVAAPRQARQGVTPLPPPPARSPAK